MVSLGNELGDIFYNPKSGVWKINFSKLEKKMDEFLERKRPVLDKAGQHQGSDDDFQVLSTEDDDNKMLEIVKSKIDKTLPETIQLLRISAISGYEFFDFETEGKNIPCFF